MTRCSWTVPPAFLLVFTLFSGSGICQEKEPAPPKKVELHKLGNEELLKSAKAIYDKVHTDYLAQLRAVAAAEAFLDEASKDAAEASKIKDGAGEKKGSPAEAAEKAVALARARHEHAKQALKRVEAQKEWLQQIATRLEAVQSAAIAFQNALEELRGYVIEIGLRAKDGSLTPDQVPPVLEAAAVDKRKQSLADEIARHKMKQADAQRRLAETATQLEAGAKAVRAADAELTLASSTLAREQKRLEMEKAHAGRKSDELIAELVQLIDDGVGLKGAYELALGQFKAGALQAARLREELEHLKAPAAKITEMTRGEDLEQAAKSLQKLIEYYNARTTKIGELRGALARVAKEGGEFEADAAVSSEHLFKMNVIAGMLEKAGVSPDKLPSEGGKERLAQAAARQAKSASDVLAETEKAKTELAVLEKLLADTKAAGAAAARQLDNVKQSREGTLAALEWENKLKDLSAAQVVEAFLKTRALLDTKMQDVKDAEAAYRKELTAVVEAKARLAAAKGLFMRAAEEEGRGEKQKLLGELRKEAGLAQPAKAEMPAPTEPIKAGNDKKPEVEKKPEPEPTKLEKASAELAAFQQSVAGRLRGIEEQTAKQRDLETALSNLEKKASELAKTLNQARQLALEWNASAMDLKKRVGKGELEADKMPPGASESLRGELRGKLDSENASLLTVLAQTQQEREKLARADTDGVVAKSTRDVLELVGKRIDLLAELKRLDAEYKRDRSSLSPSEAKRLEQTVQGRMDEEAAALDRFLGLGSSRSAKTISELLETYYRELIELEAKEANLARQKDKMNQLVELAQKESLEVAKLLPLLEKRLPALESLREEELLLARARLKPDQADELLQAYQLRSGKVLARPIPIPDKEKAEKAEELAALVFERYVQVEAAKRWQGVLALRVAPGGIQKESGAYQDELASLNTTSAANHRRITALTGNAPAEPNKEGKPEPTAAATGGEIGVAREELRQARWEGLQSLGIKIGVIIIVALFLPGLLVAILRRALGVERGGSSELVLSALRTFLRITIWVSALAIILSLLGLDVTAIVAGLGIGGLAIGLAAQSMISDIIAAFVIFIERRFKTGDVIRLDEEAPARVLGLSWRSTQVRDTDGLIVNIPNRKITNSKIQNLTKQGRTYDSLTVTIRSSKDLAPVLEAVKQAAEESPGISDHALAVKQFTRSDQAKEVKYAFSWFLPDYEVRNKIRDDIFARISARLNQEDMAGAEVTLA